MRPTEILSGEHRVIEQVLDCLAKMVEDCRDGGEIDHQAVKDAVLFFRMFADKCHHGKEETHLFPKMEERGFPRDGGPTGVMLQEHELGRMHVLGMEEAADAVAVERFIEHAEAYIELLREHIQKEDHCLFAMANQAFSESDQEELAASFEKVENEEMGQHEHAKYVDIANKLAEKFGVKQAEPTLCNTHKHTAASCGRPCN